MTTNKCLEDLRYLYKTVHRFRRGSLQPCPDLVGWICGLLKLRAPDVLIAEEALIGFISAERSSPSPGDPDVLAAAEFIGLRDESVPDLFEGRQHKLKRGGKHLGITTPRNARNHLDRCLSKLLIALEGNLRKGRNKTNPGNVDADDTVERDGDASSRLTRNRAFVIVNRENQYVIDKEGATISATMFRSLRAVKPDTRVFSCTYGRQGHPASLVTPEIGHGGAIVETHRTESGYCRIVIELDRTLNPTDPAPHELSWRWNLKGGIKHPWLRSKISAPILRYAIRVEFLDPKLPNMVSSFQSTSLFDSQFVSPDSRLAFDQNGFYSYEFREPDLREWCGINWR